MIGSIYIAAKLFSPADRLMTLLMSEAIAKVKSFSSTDIDIYVPYRDSNEVVSTDGDMAQNIFDADIKQLLKTDMLIARLDGMSYDAGIGVEIGVCVARDVPVAVFSMDYYDMSIANRKIMYAPLLDQVAHCPRFDYKRNIEDYEGSLHENIDQFEEFLQKELENEDCKSPKYVLGNSTLQQDTVLYDVFVDISGLQYEWCSIIANMICDRLNNFGYSYWVSNRYLPEYSANEDIRALRHSRIMLVSLDETEPNIDSSILQGYAYQCGIYTIGYESIQVKRFVEGKQEMHINLMNEKACKYIANSIENVVKKIKEVLEGNKSCDVCT